MYSGGIYRGSATLGLRAAARLRVRDSPPGPGDQMDGLEFLVLSGLSNISYKTQTNSASGGSETSSVDEMDEDKDDGDDDNNDADDDDNDDIDNDSNDDEPGGEPEPEPEIEPDDPPVRDGGSATTVGFEFELFIAVSRIDEETPDPHPEDARWLSEHLTTRSSQGLAFKYTCRNKIIDLLTAKGVSAHKTNERMWAFAAEYETGGDQDFQWWDSLEYEDNNTNDVVSNWRGNWQWNLLEPDDDNVTEGVNALLKQFIQYHRDNNLEPYMTRQATIRDVRDAIILMVEGDVPDGGRMRILTLWYEKAIEYIENEKKTHYSALGDPDPNLPPGLQIKPQYMRWSCTDDISITNVWPTEEDYVIPPDSIPIDPETEQPFGFPPHLYQWFGAEVVSSVQDYDNPQTYPTLKTACAAIRDAMRIHKPMAIIETGVHIHVGQQAGWTLLHLKKFATLWHLVEPSIFRLHRKERRNSMWCQPLSTQSNLARLVYRRDETCRFIGATAWGPKKLHYERQMEQYIPDLGDRRRLREFLHHIWTYDSITQLDAAMVTTITGEGCIRWRVSGEKLSEEPGETRRLQTLEFRLMQGTLDAEHIWKWAGILERLVIFARDSTPEAYSGVLTELLTQKLPQALGINKDDLKWFESRATDEGHFAYPENGAINWSDPFMAPGYGDTHGASVAATA
ncbi:hypothetical protein GGR58DRAFT_514527 [Xylaria digitata]|nr:hypothetical protein GGR58DRAFT_514527 [Xylaria digitata]